MQMNRRYLRMPPHYKYQFSEKHANWQQALAKVSEEERKKQDSEYINRGLAKEAALIEGGNFESSGSKTQRIPIGGVEVRGERFEIGNESQGRY